MVIYDDGLAQREAYSSTWIMFTSVQTVKDQEDLICIFRIKSNAVVADDD
jgi:hypothetical protein